jgi:hypothetical protein
MADEAELRAGVVGVGALGRHHARVWASLPGARLVGVCDADAGRAAEVAARHGCPAFPDADALLAEADVLSVAVPTVDHHAVARRALERGRDVLLEKPMTASLEEADDLVALAAARGAVLQVGHIERFNPATEALLTVGKGARFVEVHRLGSFSPRSLDVDVVLDLMIHDLDIVLALDGRSPSRSRPLGCLSSPPPCGYRERPAPVRSGLIMNLTASRVSVEKTRKFRCSLPDTSRRTSPPGSRRSTGWKRTRPAGFGSRAPGRGRRSGSLGCRSRRSLARSGSGVGRSCWGRTGGGFSFWPTPSSAGWRRPDARGVRRGYPTPTPLESTSRGLGVSEMQHLV